MKFKYLVGVFIMICASLAAQAQSEWQKTVQSEMPLLGHRNWIAIVDSAYPLQSANGIETIDTHENHLAVLDYVLRSIEQSRHVRAIAHTDRELQFVPESDAPGVSRLREELKARLAGLPADAMPHQTLIDRLNATSREYHVLVLKTRMTIPYSSVFLQLDCRYWGAESETKLREAMQAAEK